MEEPSSLHYREDAPFNWTLLYLSVKLGWPIPHHNFPMIVVAVECNPTLTRNSHSRQNESSYMIDVPLICHSHMPVPPSKSLWSFSVPFIAIILTYLVPISSNSSHILSSFYFFEGWKQVHYQVLKSPTVARAVDVSRKANGSTLILLLYCSFHSSQTHDYNLIPVSGVEELGEVEGESFPQSFVFSHWSWWLTGILSCC